MDKKYIPLYRKYRPSTFEDVVGQEVVVKTLTNAILSNRVAHAYLFCGPRGTGKTSIARIFAKTLNCLNPVDNKPCGKCAHCIDMENTNPMDVIEIDAASNRKVEDARDLLERVYYAPSIGKNKIYIIDEVHMLTKEAFNTLLKTLEEPPENLIFILATTESHKVLETIVSRCQKFDFRRITVKDIENRLKYVAKQENINIEDSALEFIAKKSAGGLRDALALLDQSSVLAAENQTITKDNITSLLGNISDEDLFNITDEIIEKNPQKLIVLTKKILDNGNDPMQIMKELVEYLRNLLLASVCQNAREVSELLDISPENCEEILAQSHKFSPQELAQILDALKEQEINIRNSANPYIWLDVALISITTRENISAEKSVLDRIEALENRQISVPVPRPMPKIPDIIQKPQPSMPVQTNNSPSIAEKQQEKLEENFQNEAQIPNTSIQNKAEEKIENQVIETKIDTEITNEKQAESQPTQKEEIAQIEEPKQANENYSWDTLLGMLQKINPVAYALIKPHSKILEFTPEKIILGLKNEDFIKKANAKKMFLEQASKEYFGKVPELSFRLLSQEDFKKKIASDEKNSTLNKQSKEISNPNTQTNIDERDTSEEEYYDDKVYSNTPNNISHFDIEPDLSDDVKNFLDIFGGKIL